MARLVDVVDGSLRWGDVDPALWRSTPVAQTADHPEPTAVGLAGQFDAPSATAPRAGPDPLVDKEGTDADHKRPDDLHRRLLA